MTDSDHGSGEAVPSQEEYLGYFETLSNWGRWGDEDQLGTFNLVTPEKRVQAASLVREGHAVSLAGVIDPDNPDRLGRGTEVQRYMQLFEGDEWLRFAREKGHHKGTFEEDHNFFAVRDYLGMITHGSVTHVDGLAHVGWNGSYYNGFKTSDTTTLSGARALSLHHAATGLFTRGVLLDIAALHGVEWLEPGYRVGIADLEAAEKRQGVRVEPGDVLLVHTGNFARLEKEGAHPEGYMAGYGASTLPWLHERDVVLISADAATDAHPSGYSRVDMTEAVHTVGMVAMGMWILDNMELTELAAACAQRSRWEFLYTMQNLKVVGLSGIPVNPVVVF